MMENKWNKNCPKCGCEQIYSCEKSLKNSLKINRWCRKCATKESAKYIDRSYQKTEEYRNMMSIKIKTVRKVSKNYNSEECLEKLRIAKLNQIQKFGSSKNYNPKACKFIDNFGKKNGYNFQHAMNGGEVIVSGYSLDGYDEDKNIVFEYDEKKHQAPSVKKYDKIRENRIIKKINPNLFIRYDECFDKLYDVIGGKEIL